MCIYTFDRLQVGNLKTSFKFNKDHVDANDLRMMVCVPCFAQNNPNESCFYYPLLTLIAKNVWSLPVIDSERQAWCLNPIESACIHFGA